MEWFNTPNNLLALSVKNSVYIAKIMAEYYHGTFRRRRHTADLAIYAACKKELAARPNAILPVEVGASVIQGDGVTALGVFWHDTSFQTYTAQAGLACR
jgi:hypothetical protein